jgi:hypothetical protein
MTPEGRKLAKAWIEATDNSGEAIEVVELLRVALAALEAAEEREESAKADLVRLVGLLQRCLQPGGSPPPLSVVGTAEWIIRYTVDEIASLEKLLREALVEIAALKAELEFARTSGRGGDPDCKHPVISRNEGRYCCDLCGEGFMSRNDAQVFSMKEITALNCDLGAQMVELDDLRKKIREAEGVITGIEELLKAHGYGGDPVAALRDAFEKSERQEKFLREQILGLSDELTEQIKIKVMFSNDWELYREALFEIAALGGMLTNDNVVVACAMARKALELTGKGTPK